MKKVLGVLGVLVLLFALAACEEAGAPITAKMLEGAWEFAEGYEVFFHDELDGIIDGEIDKIIEKGVRTISWTV